MNTPAQFRVIFVCIFAALAAGSGACGGDPDDPLKGLRLVTDDRSDLALADLSDDLRARFNTGDRLFDLPFREVQGLGPLYIRQSCSACHANDGRGPGVVRKMVLVAADGRTPLDDQSALQFGHTIRPLMAAGAKIAITAPEDRADILLTKREPPAVYGRGYIEAIDNREIERVEAAQARAGGAISGRINRVEYASEPNPETRFHRHERGQIVIGRFGLKARIATLDDFAADALQGDMGITSDLRPRELANPAGEDDEVPGIDLEAESVNALADYMRLLRIPKRGPDAADAAGLALFEQAQCSQCHVPSLRTRKDYPIEALAGIDAPVFSDLLLHDMGDEFSDGLADYGASASEWRTAPLLGLRHLQRYLHDGRADTIEQAIELHGGPGSEAAESAARFGALAPAARARLVKFVSAL